MRGGTGGHSNGDARACSARRGGQGRSAAARPAARPPGRNTADAGSAPAIPARVEGPQAGKSAAMCQGGLMPGTAVAPVQPLAVHGIRCAGRAGRAVHPATGSEGLQDAPAAVRVPPASAKSCGILAAPHVLHGAGGAARCGRVPSFRPPRSFGVLVFRPPAPPFQWRGRCDERIMARRPPAPLDAKGLAPGQGVRSLAWCARGAAVHDRSQRCGAGGRAARCRP